MSEEKSNVTYHIYGGNSENTTEITTTDAIVNVSVSANINPMSKPSSRRMRRTTYQARLGRKLDHIGKKVLDNNIRLTSNPTDMLRIAVKRDERSRDLISRTIVGVEVLPIILPNMEDIPLRHFIREGNDILIPSFYDTPEREFFEVWAPIEVDLNEDDLLIRILKDSSTEIENPYVMVLQVKEILGTFGQTSLMWKKLLCTFYDESLDPRIINIIKENIKKRELLGW